MALNKLIILFIFFNITFSEPCKEKYIDYDGYCYLKNDVDILQNFIDLNIKLKKHPIEIGFQEWENGRLVHLYLGAHQIKSIPENINLLDHLNTLDLRNNLVANIPENICEFNMTKLNLNLNNNFICPPYPICIDYLDKQNIDDCENFSCNDDFKEINKSCYYKYDIDILQNIIDTNPELNNLEPLDLGKDIGYQEWKNGRLSRLILPNNNLTYIPESICSIYHDLDGFDVSNNAICPPYPSCFEYIGYQNTQNCEFYTCPEGSLGVDGLCYNQEDLSVLIDFIDQNPSLSEYHPFEIGQQEWLGDRLISIDLSASEIIKIPDSIQKLDALLYLVLRNNHLTELNENICNIEPNLKIFDVSNNFICPPYPHCFDFVGQQYIVNCENANNNFVDLTKQDSISTEISCLENFIEIEKNCYYKSDLDILQNIIDHNSELKGTKPLDLGNKNGLQEWKNGRLSRLILPNNNLTYIPESICSIYHDLEGFDVSNNAICPPYPSCFEYIGYQNTQNCEFYTCPEGSLEVDGLCYNQEDLSVLIDFIDYNPLLNEYHPFEIGQQEWLGGRLISLYLDEYGITKIPDSIQKLDALLYLVLRNNHLTELNENICNIEPNLKIFDVSNNFICPPYPHCFDFVGQQYIVNCEDVVCPEKYIEIDKHCYFESDINILQEFIDQNPSLTDRPLLNIGYQEWKNRRLEFLYLGGHDLKIIPKSIDKLTELVSLDLRNNKFEEIPESICNIYPNLKAFNISNNSICPPYPICLDNQIYDQNQTSCP